jgi:hypothetical protein
LVLASAGTLADLWTQPRLAIADGSDLMLSLGARSSVGLGCFDADEAEFRLWVRRVAFQGVWAVVFASLRCSRIRSRKLFCSSAVWMSATARLSG